MSQRPPEETAIRWVDNHCHLENNDEGRAEIADVQQSGVEKLVNVGTDHATSLDALALAREFNGIVFSTAGIHPHEATKGLKGIKELLDDPHVVAVGECGLDYHYNHSPPPTQRKVFAEHIALAHEFDMPLVIHARDAWDEIFSILKTEKTPARTVFHCFTGGPNEAEMALSCGALLSFSGIVTFKNAKNIREAMLQVPLDRFMIETDSPYLTPVPLRGQRNSPRNLPLVGFYIAEERQLDLRTLSEQLWSTTHKFYGLPREDTLKNSN
tara:strand:+ start:6084 stop:6890 length:807 start_codon:yes stop_codon:yes gene_type:complete